MLGYRPLDTDASCPDCGFWGDDEGYFECPECGSEDIVVDIPRDEYEEEEEYYD